MTRLALAAALVASLAAPAFAQPSSGSNNTPQGGAVRMGEAGEVDRKPDVGAATGLTTPRQAPAAGGERSGGPSPAPTANPTVGSGSPTGTTR